MDQLFVFDQGQDFIAVIKEVTDRVVDLGFRDVQGLGDVGNRFAALLQCDDMTDCHTQAVNQLERELAEHWSLNYIEEYITYHKTNEPKKYSAKMFKVIRPVNWQS